MSQSSNSGMSISRLIQSTSKVKGYGVSTGNLRTKKFGSIYTFNKKIKVKPNSSIIEVSMLIESTTEKKNKNSSDKGLHRVMMAISGVKQQEVDGDTLVTIIRLYRPQYADETKYDKETLIKLALDSQNSIHDSERKTLLEGITVFESDKKGYYVLVENTIKDSAKIQVWCSCSSYYWVFQYYNLKAGVNIKSPSTVKTLGAYRYKTQKGFEEFKKGRPMRNPNQVPGMCKHLMLLLAMLMESKIVQRESESAKRLMVAFDFNKFKNKQRISDAEYDKLMKDFDKEMKEVQNERKFNAMSGEVARSQRNNGYEARGVNY